MSAWASGRMPDLFWVELMHPAVVLYRWQLRNAETWRKSIPEQNPAENQANHTCGPGDPDILFGGIKYFWDFGGPGISQALKLNFVFKHNYHAKRASVTLASWISDVVINGSVPPVLTFAYTLILSINYHPPPSALLSSAPMPGLESCDTAPRAIPSELHMSPSTDPTTAHPSPLPSSPSIDGASGNRAKSDLLLVILLICFFLAAAATAVWFSKRPSLRQRILEKVLSLFGGSTMKIYPLPFSAALPPPPATPIQIITPPQPLRFRSRENSFDRDPVPPYPGSN